MAASRPAKISQTGVPELRSARTMLMSLPTDANTSSSVKSSQRAEFNVLVGRNAIFRSEISLPVISYTNDE